jgi:hypothetical protein
VLKTIAVVVVILIIVVVAILAYAATMPDTFRVQRSAAIKAPAEKIFPFIADFRAWTVWSPYEHRDPALKRTYGGAEKGKGATYAWEGNRNVGAGNMEIVEATLPSRILIKLNFLRPFEASNTAEFTLEPKGDVTVVTWAMEGRSLFIGKVMSVFINMDRMVGKDFEDGLANLRTVAEK